MGSTDSKIHWNSVPFNESTHCRQQPTWTYYSQVSVAGPAVRVADREVASMYATRGTLRGQEFHPPVAALPATLDRPSGSSIPVSHKSDAKQWGPWSLTQRELEVIQLLAEGATNSEMSERLVISPKTTKNHLAAIFQKLDVTNRTQALVRAVVMGLVSIE
jgi:DNA-binding NarL/FixJ family response regulator